MARTTRNLLCLLAFSAGMAVPALALADVAPPNACNTDGGVCNTAGKSYNQPGICTKTTCQKQLPGDGGISSYDCFLCTLQDGGGSGGSGGAGTGGSSATGGSGGAATGGSAGAAPKKKSGSSGGCSVSAPGQRSGFAGLILLGGLGLLGFGRRRR